MAHLSLSLLGTIQVTLNEEPVTEFKYDKVKALLAYLAVEADSPHRREALAGLLWPDRSEQAARISLRQALTTLRQAISDDNAGPPFLLVTRETIQFNPASDYWLDVTAFTALLTACEMHPHRRLETCKPCNQRLEQAVALYRGDFLKEFFLADSATFEEWARTERERFHCQALNALLCLAAFYEERGQHEQAQRYALRQLELEPWREEAHRQMMRLLALSGQRSAALIQYETCCRVLAEELGVEPAEETTALYEQIRTGDLSRGAEEQGSTGEFSSVLELENPYKGLHAFRETDAPDFFGREAFTERLAETVHQQSLTVVIGPSGSGKSSVVFAGLVPRLEAEAWLIADFRPGSRPFHHLAGALIPLLEPHTGETGQRVETGTLAQGLSQGDLSLYDVVGRILRSERRLLLVVDQFEELYTLCPEPETRQRFLDCLLSLTTDHCSLFTAHCSLILTLRADFMGQALAYRPFADALQSAGLILGPMTHQELERAIEEPARGQGVTFEPGLVARILDDVGNEPGNLPMLQFALTSLWEQSAGCQLTHAGYEAIGRVDGALACYADKVYAGLSPTGQEQARRIFRQMVRPGEGTEDTRRLATRAELGEDGWALVQRLADARLVVTDRDPTGQETVEVVHEALIRGWGQLQAWMDADRVFRTWQERLRAALHQWKVSNHDEGALLHGAPLTKAEGWLVDRETDLSPAERAFIRASVALRDRRQAEREWERTTRERLRRQVTLGLAAGLVIAILLALMAVWQWRQAETQHQIALSNQLVAQALHRLDNQQFDLALLLSLEAYRTADTLETRSSLLTALQRVPYRAILRHHTNPVSSVTFSPDGQMLVSSSSDGTVALWEVSTLLNPSVSTLRNPFDPERKVGQNAILPYVLPAQRQAFQTSSERLSEPEGARVLAAPNTGGVTAQPISEPLVHPQEVNSVAFSPDGQMLALASGDGTVVLMERAISKSLAGHTDGVESVAFSPDGQTLASGSRDNTIILWDVATRHPIGEPLAGHTGAVKSIAFSPDGRTLASGSVDDTWGHVDNTVILWDMMTGEPSRGLRTGHSYRGNVTSLAFSPEGRILAVGIGLGW